MSKISWHYLVLCFLFCTVSSNDFAQWMWQNPLPQGNRLYSDYFTDSITGYADVSFIKLCGGQVLTGRITGLKNQLDIIILPAGDYFVRLTSENMVQVGKFIKQ